MNYRFAFVLGFLTLSNAFADWRHTNFQTAQGIEVGVDFDARIEKNGAFKSQTCLAAYPQSFFINLRKASLSSSSQVRVVLNHYGFNSESSTPETYTLDLGYQGDHFSGRLFNAKLNRGSLELTSPVRLPLLLSCEGYAGLNLFTRQTVSVVVDGEWLTDPATGSTQFPIDLAGSRKE